MLLSGVIQSLHRTTLLPLCCGRSSYYNAFKLYSRSTLRSERWRIDSYKIRPLRRYPHSQNFTGLEAIGNFEDKHHAILYANYRPVYPNTVPDIIISYMKSNCCSGFQCAVDVGCGSGQSTFLLSEYFEEVFGYDSSQEQIIQANSKVKTRGEKNIHFRVGDAHNLPLKTSSVDLVTCAASWHWFDAEKFSIEAKRVLKRKGCMAVYCYNTRITENEYFERAMNVFRNELLQTGCYTDQTLCALNSYEAVELPFSQAQRFSFSLPQRASMDQLIGFMSSISSYRAYCKFLPLNNLLENIRSVYEKESGKCAASLEEFSYPGFIIIGMN